VTTSSCCRVSRLERRESTCALSAATSDGVFIRQPSFSLTRRISSPPPGVSVIDWTFARSKVKTFSFGFSSVGSGRLASTK